MQKAQEKNWKTKIIRQPGII